MADIDDLPDSPTTATTGHPDAHAEIHAVLEGRKSPSGVVTFGTNVPVLDAGRTINSGAQLVDKTYADSLTGTAHTIQEHTNGGVSVRATSPTLTTTDDHVQVGDSDAASGAFTLPSAAEFDFLIKRDGSNTVTVARGGSDTFDDGSTLLTLNSDHAAVRVFSSGDGNVHVLETGVVTRS